MRTHDDNYHPWYDFENSLFLLNFIFIFVSITVRPQMSGKILFWYLKIFLFFPSSSSYSSSFASSSINIMKVSCQSTDWKVVFLFIYITIKYININYAFLSALLSSQSQPSEHKSNENFIFCLIYLYSLFFLFRKFHSKWNNGTEVGVMKTIRRLSFARALALRLMPFN